MRQLISSDRIISIPQFIKREYPSATEQFGKVHTLSKQSSQSRHFQKICRWYSFCIVVISDKNNCFSNHFLTSQINLDYIEGVKVATPPLAFLAQSNISKGKCKNIFSTIHLAHTVVRQGSIGLVNDGCQAHVVWLRLMVKQFLECTSVNMTTYKP